MSADGTTALIGADGASSAYVFHVTAEGSWASSSSPAATLANSGGAAGDEFGDSAALSADGTTALIGADGANSAQGTGAADVFHVTGEGTWASSSSPAATLTGPAAVKGGSFGSSVAMSGDGTTALITDGEGHAYVFHVTAEGSWASSSSPAATLKTPASAFSAAMSADGTTALVTAPEVSSDQGTGAAYVFHVTAEGSWAKSSSSPAATLTEPAGGAGSADDDCFAASAVMSADGTTALIGTIGVQGGLAWGMGEAYVSHVPREGSWASSSSVVAELTDPVEQGGPLDGSFGSLVAMSADGTTALVGTDDQEEYVFQVTSEGSWATSSSSPAATLNRPGVPAEDSFGSAVAMSADGATVLVGAPGVSSGIGAAYVFHALGVTSVSTTTTTPHVGKSQPGPAVAALATELSVANKTVEVQLRCSGAACRGTVSLDDGKVPFGTTSYQLGAGKTASFEAHLTSTALQLLAKAGQHAIKVTETVTVTGGKTVEGQISLVG
jgi:hypothetical protein